MVQNNTFFRHILHILGDDISPSMSPGEYLRMAADWFSGAHAWQFLQRPLFLDLRGAISLAGATYTHSSRTITKTGAFANYSIVAGDRFEASAGTGVTARSYVMASRTSDDAIVLAGDGLGSGADGSTDVSGRLPNDSIALPADFMAFPGANPIWSSSSIIRGVSFTTREAMTQRRTSNIEVESSWFFYAAVTELLDQSTGQTNPVLEIYPPASTNTPDAFRGYYRARLVIDPTAETAIVPLPIGRPALELALVKACRAFALGFEEGEEAGKPSLEVLLDQLVRSPIWEAAKKQDGLQQPTVGPIRGGVGGSRMAGRRLLSTEVDAPT